MKSKTHKSSLYVFSAVFNAALGSFLFGYMIGVFNPTQTCIEIVNNWSDSEKTLYDGLVTGLAPIGAIIGAFMGGLLGTKYGRRLSFIIADIIGIIGCVVWIFKGTPLFIGRFIAGIAVGINSALVPVYINEISPSSISGSTGAITSLMLNTGILVAYFFGLNIPKAKTIREDPDGENFWKFMFAFPIITCFLRILLLFTVYNYETPSYLISEGRNEEAKLVIKKIYYEENNDEIYNDYKMKLEKSNNITFGELFSSKYRNRMFIGISLCWVQQFSGINAVLFYSTKIFTGDKSEDEIDPFDDKMAKVFTILIGVILIISSWLSGLFIDKYGRKSILLIGEGFCIFTLLLLTIFGYKDLTEPSKYIILLYALAYGLSLGPIVWLYLPEILPEKGVSLAALTNWVFCGIIGLFFPIVKDAIKIQGTFLLFLCCCCISMVYMIVFVKETKNKSSDEIEKMFVKETKEDDQLLNSDKTSAGK